jgi:hypothetical protein
VTAMHSLFVLYAIAGLALSALTYGREALADPGTLFGDGGREVLAWKVGVLLLAMAAAAAACWPIFLCDWLIGLAFRLQSRMRSLQSPLLDARLSRRLIVDRELSGVSGSAYLAALFAPARVERRIKPCVCPTCGHSPVADVVYGAPETIYIEAVRGGTIVLGGCVHSANSPEWKCSFCRQAIRRVGK